MKKNETGFLSYIICENQLELKVSRHEIVNLLEKNIGNELLDISLGTDSLDLTLKTKAIKAKINKCEYIKLKPFA